MSHKKCVHTLKSTPRLRSTEKMKWSTFEELINALNSERIYWNTQLGKLKIGQTCFATLRTSYLWIMLHWIMTRGFHAKTCAGFEQSTNDCAQLEQCQKLDKSAFFSWLCTAWAIEEWTRHKKDWYYRKRRQHQQIQNVETPTKDNLMLEPLSWIWPRIIWLEESCPAGGTQCWTPPRIIWFWILVLQGRFVKRPMRPHAVWLKRFKRQEYFWTQMAARSEASMQ